MLHFDGESLEIIGAEMINVMLSEDGRRVWVCTENGTVLRAKLGKVDDQISLEDRRLKKEPDDRGPLPSAYITEFLAKAACAAWWGTFGGSEDPGGEWEGLDETERGYWRWVAVSTLRGTIEKEPENEPS